MRERSIDTGLLPWASVWVALVALQIGVAAASDEPIGSATLLFWLVVVAASGCVVTALWLLRNAHRDDVAELGLIGSYMFAVSALPLVHGLTVPGVWYGPNEAVLTSAAWAVPLAVVAATPLLLPRRTLLLRHWRPWVVANLVADSALAVALLVEPSLLPSVDFGRPLPTVLAVVGLAGSVLVSARHLRLYRISRRPVVLAVSLSFASIASGNLVWIGGRPMTAGFWLAHLLDVAGVFTATVVGAVALRRHRVEVDVFRPLTLRDPLDALEYGLDPVVRDFVADLARKDAITAEHVKRTAEAAIEVGERLGLDPEELRVVGLGALLHDVGKIAVPDDILTKPGRLTDEEFAVVRTHAAIGADMVAGSTLLEPVAPTIRHHHERMDGSGYPDRLIGSAIPLTARIVSVCDAWDAMVHTRQYREGMGDERARSILAEHAGTQWDPQVVTAFLDTLDEGRIAAEPTVLADVASVGCSCVTEIAFDLAPTAVIPQPG